jgi:hypothetical protein
VKQGWRGVATSDAEFLRILERIFPKYFLHFSNHCHGQISYFDTVTYGTLREVQTFGRSQLVPVYLSGNAFQWTGRKPESKLELPATAPMGTRVRNGAARRI